MKHNTNSDRNTLFVQTKNITPCLTSRTPTLQLLLQFTNTWHALRQFGFSEISDRGETLLAVHDGFYLERATVTTLLTHDRPVC